MNLKRTIFRSLIIIIGFFLFSALPITDPAGDGEKANWDFDLQLEKYLLQETERISDRSKKEISNINNWEGYQTEAREELNEMLGLQGVDSNTDLKAVITGVTEHEEFTIENVHFQSIPGLYVTGNLYIPKNVSKPLPAILYVCGHAGVKDQGISYGSKVHYQHHAVWFAKNGYVCLIIDTFQLGEIEGVHHGKYSKDRWWWISRGYTPAGVEALNSKRAIDYLHTRPEVDTTRLGVTGRSGGGIYSWWLGAIDERVSVSVPVAGITDLKDYVVDGCVDMHCDCMYMSNIYQWDYTKLPILTVPRPLMICNTDRDPYFPFDGVYRVYEPLEKAYEALEVRGNLGLNVAPGFHQDLQDIRLPAFRWFNHHLKGTDAPIEDFSDKPFTKEQLKVFETLPTDEINTRIDEVFVKQADPIAKVLADQTWEEAKNGWMESLQKEVFRNWPKQEVNAELTEIQRSTNKKLTGVLYQLKTDQNTWLPVFWMNPGSKSNKTRIIVLDDYNWEQWQPLLAGSFPDLSFFEGVKELSNKSQELSLKDEDLIFISIRGAGPASYSVDKWNMTQIKRRFYLLGQTLEQMQTWDILQAVRAIKPFAEGKDLSISASDQSANLLIYASIYFGFPTTLDLENPHVTHMTGPAYMNILKHMDVPASLLLAADEHTVNIRIGFEEKAEIRQQWNQIADIKSGYPELDLNIQPR